MSDDVRTLSTGRQVCLGCKPTPRHRLAKAPWAFRRAPVLPPPPPDCDGTGGVKDWNMYGNDQYGVCVTAEEGNAKKCVSLATGADEVNIPTENLVSWASRHGFLNGAYLDEVLDKMGVSGIPDANGIEHRDGAHGTIDWTDKQEFMQAVQYFKTIKIAVSANQLLQVVGNSNGWVLHKAYVDHSADHCVGIYAYGSAEFLAKLCGLTSVPNVLDPKEFCVLLYTWETIGIVTWQAFLAITSEAWVRITDPDRGDAEVWDKVAAEHFAAISDDLPHPAPTPNPNPTPGPTPRPPTRRAIDIINRLAKEYDANPQRIHSLLDWLEGEYLP